MLKNQNSQNTIARARRVHRLLRVFAVAALVFALPAIYPIFTAAAAGKFSASLVPLAQMKESLRAMSNLIAGSGTGVVEICKSASGSGLENKVFQFKVSGIAGVIQVPVGRCSSPIQVPAGMVMIEEMPGGSFTDQPGSFTGGFRLLDATVIQSDPSQPNPIVSKNLPARTVTLNVQEGSVQNGTVIQFLNTYAAVGFVEICNQSSGETGFVQYAVPGVAQNVIVPRNSCSAPIQVTIPATFGASGATGTVRINQLSKQGVTLESATTNPSDRFNGVTLGLGINMTNQECLNAPDPALVAGCTFNNSGGGYVDVDVFEGGISQETLVYFNNRVEPARLLKICKVAGPGVAVGTNFTFDFYINNEPEIGAAPVTVPAGDPSMGGNCVFAQGQSAPFLNGISSFPANSTVTVVERPAAGFLVSSISSPNGGTISNVNLAQRKATIAIADGVNLLSFTNMTAAPVSAPTSAGTNVSVAPTTDLNLTFGSISTAGTTTVTVLPVEDVPLIPSGFALSGSSLIYEITTSAAFTGNITVSFDVPNVADAAACSQLVILHYTNGAWDTSGNAVPVYDGDARTCTVSQIVTSLSPFGVGELLDSDNDGVPDITDAFPLDPNESVDTDGDETGNNADTDDDNDGQSDEAEIACGSNPLDAASKCAPPTNGPPTSIEQCKNGGWKLFDKPRRFKNQGDCIQFVNTGK